jgi:large subunit ribosomal protein L30
MSQLKITQVKSEIGQTKRQRGTLRGLGLKRIGQTVVRQDTPAVRGMLRAVGHLVNWEETNDDN